MEYARDHEFEEEIQGDAELLSLIEDTLSDSEVEVESSGNVLRGNIFVRSENPFTVVVGSETIFASDIERIRSLDTDAVWKISDIMGVIDTDYRPDLVRAVKNSSKEEAKLPPVPRDAKETG